ncbi:MAG: hypothetical protein ACLFTK_07120 [Anaerolineales bacterium]
MYPTIEDILAEYADSLATGRITPAELVKKYNLPPGSDAEALVYFAAKLEDVLYEVRASDVFVAHLRADLLGTSKDSLAERLRALTPAQVMAGIGGMTVVAGIVWLVRRNAQERRDPERLNPMSVISPVAS